MADLQDKKDAVIMVDADSWQTQLMFYGYGKEGYENDVYEHALPRLVNLFEKMDVKATFFIVGAHARVKENRNLLKRLSDEGHELANHSMNHPKGFSALTEGEKEAEIKDCAMAIEDITGKKVKGFRAPDYDIDEKTIDILTKNGYAYDASVFPTFMALPMKFMHFILSGGKKAHTMGRELLRFSPTGPYRPDAKALHKNGNAGIVELPLTVTPFFRLPFYGTFVMAFGKRYFDFTYSLLRKKPFLNYTFHAFETADKDRDSVDKRLLKHPGLKRPLEEKESLCAEILEKIRERFNFVTAEKYVEGLNI